MAWAVSTLRSRRCGIWQRIDVAPYRRWKAAKGLIVNSRNLCSHKSKAKAAFTAHSGKTYKENPVVKAGCGGKKRPAK